MSSLKRCHGRRTGIAKPGRRETSSVPSKRSRVDPEHMRVREFLQRVWLALDTPFSRSLAYAGSWEECVTAKPLLTDKTDALDFFLDHQAAKLGSKNPHLPTGINTRKVAEKKFIEAEKACLETNARLRDPTTRVSPRLNRVLHAAQRKIADILGPVPSLDALPLSFGPGASFGVRKTTTAYHKLTARLESTHSMITVLPQLLAEVPGWVEADQAEIALVYGSDLTFVSKDATTDRAICIEPLLNGFLQKGIGSYIRMRLLLFGINLRDQMINQNLAQKALERLLSTVDFSSASDTIAYNLVWDLLPPDWCELLDAARCPSYRYEGSWYQFQKFSSMGNAYTFELETLLFYALAFACCVEVDIRPETGRNLHVYGDDVIIPRGAFDLFKEVTAYCGFTINPTKSFWSGWFYESCGSDYFENTLVTPYRLKRGLRTERDIIYAANLLIRLAARICDVSTLEQKTSAGHKARLANLAHVHRWLLSLIPPSRMVLGPFSDGDDWLACPFDRARPHKGVFGFRHRRLIAQPVKFVPTDGIWPKSYALYSAYKAGSGEGEDAPPVLWSEGAALRSVTRDRLGVTWSSDWAYPIELVGYFFTDFSDKKGT